MGIQGYGSYRNMVKWGYGDTGIQGCGSYGDTRIWGYRDMAHMGIWSYRDMGLKHLPNQRLESQYPELTQMPSGHGGP
jgi:hypothetical protein